MLSGDETGGRFVLVEHPMPPRALAAPLRRHSRQDEYSFVLEGRVGARLGDDLIFKPRGQCTRSETTTPSPHAFSR